MLKRTKYTRLRNDSLSSLDDCSQRTKGELHLDSDFVQLDPGTSSNQGPSTLRDFIPRVANIRLHSPISLQTLRGQRNSAVDRTKDGPVSGSQLRPGPSQRPRSRGELLPHSGLCCAQRPLTLHRITSLSWTPLTHTALSSETWMGTRAVHHNIKYMGSVEVTQSMRTLDFDTRMQVTREAISRLCEMSAKTTVRTKRPAHKAVSDVLGQINLQFSGSSVTLSVSTDSLTLVSSSSLQRITHHHMQSISFASGGDPDMSDYIAYVAKDVSSQRACYILECPRGRACDIINTIGRAFETRFRELLSLTPSVVCSSSALRICPHWSPEEMTFDLRAKQEIKISERCDYYNMTPGKTPPAGGAEDLHISREDVDTQEVCFPRPVSLYENCSITEESAAPPAARSEVSEQCPHLSGPLIQDEGWFHGRLGRQEAESLLTCSGDFLVRESSSASGQYVLSGMEGATVRHLLLADPHGQVRTRDQVFVSIGHLVRFHMESQTPIISGSSELRLKQPILQRH